MCQKRENGFTLIEILVAVAIIALLAGIVFASVGQARAKARDAAARSDIEQLKLAIELYAETHGQYPEPGCGSANGWVGATSFGNCPEYIEGLVPTFIAELPVKESNVPGNGFIYWSNNARSAYKVLYSSSVESETVTHESPYARCPASCTQSHCQASNSGFQTTYAVQSDLGATCI